MAAIIKFQSRQVERNESGTSRTIIYSGTLEEMQEILNTQAIGSGMGGERVVSAAISQESGEIWQCEVRYQNDSINDAIVGPDDTAYGKQSAQLSCGLLSMPLEAHPKYLACWNYYLATSLPENTVPEWWETAKSTVLNDETRKNYNWVKSIGELPIGVDNNGKRWRTIRNPVKPGIESYDLATYQITESAKYPTPQKAGRMIEGKLNKIATPSQTFGLGGDKVKRLSPDKTPAPNWKCDGASISWNGKCWIATLTYTRSGDDQGWDTDLYQKEAAKGNQLEGQL